MFGWQCYAQQSLLTTFKWYNNFVSVNILQQNKDEIKENGANNYK
jgi:hypothetical protein